MSESATLNVRMNVDTRDRFVTFCNEVGISASSLMNMFARHVVLNQSVPFLITTTPITPPDVLTRSDAEFEDRLAVAEGRPLSECVPIDVGVSSIKESLGW